MKRRILSAVGSIIFVVVCKGCSSPTEPSVESVPSFSQNNTVDIISLTEPTYETVHIEEIDQPNCSGVSDVDSVIERTRDINHTIELGYGLAVDVDGKLELLGTGISVGEEISSELGYQYGVTESISRSVTVRAAPQTHMKHTIKLSEVWETGTARVTANGQTLDIPFQFRIAFSVDLVESIPMTCDLAPIQSPSTPSSSDPSFGMHIILIANQTRGQGPLHVTLDARDSFFVAADGTIFECGACTYTWRIRMGGTEIYGPENTDGRLEYTFGQRGSYFVSVYVCRSGSTTECVGSGAEIVVE